MRGDCVGDEPRRVTNGFTRTGLANAPGAAYDARTPPGPAGDPVNLPQHYARFAIEPIRFITENKLTFWQGSIIKYVCRWDGKDGLQDLKKARRFLDMVIKFLEGDPDWWKRDAQ